MTDHAIAFVAAGLLVNWTATGIIVAILLGWGFYLGYIFGRADFFERWHL